MKQLIILCHPVSEKIKKIVSNELTGLYDRYKLETELRDLYEINFNPVLSMSDISASRNGTFSEDILEEQKAVREADFILFIYPIWWMGMPAMLKGYIDRVFSEGFAYSVTNKGVKRLLKGKKVVIVNTFGQPSELYPMRFYDQSISYEKQIFESCGMDVVLHYYMETYLENVEIDFEDKIFMSKIENLRIAVKKSLSLNKNSRLSIPNAFF